MIEVYNQAMVEFESGDVIYVEKFGEVELRTHNLFGRQSGTNGSLWVFFTRILWRCN